MVKETQSSFRHGSRGGKGAAAFLRVYCPRICHCYVHLRRGMCISGSLAILWTIVGHLLCRISINFQSANGEKSVSLSFSPSARARTKLREEWRIRREREREALLWMISLRRKGFLPPPLCRRRARLIFPLWRSAARRQCARTGDRDTRRAQTPPPTRKYTAY